MYRARNGRLYPYKEMPWQYRERRGGGRRMGGASSSGGCFVPMVLIFGVLCLTFFLLGKV